MGNLKANAYFLSYVAGCPENLFKTDVTSEKGRQELKISK